MSDSSADSSCSSSDAEPTECPSSESALATELPSILSITMTTTTESSASSSSDAKPTENLTESSLLIESPPTEPTTETPTTESSEATESPPAKRAFIIEPSSIEPIRRHQHCHKSNTEETTFYHRWIIPNFSYYCLGEDSADKPHFPIIHSSRFSSPVNDKIKLCLGLYPNGFNEMTKGNISLFLKLCNPDNNNEVVFKYKFWILDAKGWRAKQFESNGKFSLGKGWGNGKFCQLDEIRKLSAKLTPGDVLTIGCEICYEDTSALESYDQDALNQLSDDCIEIKYNKELSDVVLVFREVYKDEEKEYEIRAPKAILSARSEVFAAMFEHDMKEKIDNRVEMTEVDEIVRHELLNYFYGYIPDIEFYYELHEKLLPIADKYQLHSLKSICEGELCFRINPESVGSLLLLADMHNAALLKSNCIEYIHCHSSCVESQGMKDLILTRPELYNELFEYIAVSKMWFPPTLTTDPYLHSWSYTATRVVKCSKLWTIGQFDCNHLSVNKIRGEHHFVESSSFSTKKYPSVKFRVKLYPLGENDECKDYLSLYLQLKCYDELKVAVKVRVSILVKENSAKGYTLEIGKKMSNGESIGWPRFIAREHLLMNEQLLLNGDDDQLVVLCEVNYIEHINKSLNKSGLNTFANEHKFSFPRDLLNLYQNQKLTDAVFVLGDKEVKVHKSIVAARSEVFFRMFTDTNRVQIEDVDDVEAFEQMIALVYGLTEGETRWTPKVLPLLDKFQLDSLKQVCQLALCDQLNDDNVAELLLFADKHNAKLMKTKAIEYIRRNHSVLTENHSLKVIQQENPELFYEILCYKLENWNNLVDR